MDWDLCRVFNAVAEAGSFLGASKRLGTSHPTVSRAVSSLEKQLGTRLFVRSDEGLILTAKGLQLREHTSAMETAALKAEAATGPTGPHARGSVKLSIGPTMASHWLTPHLREFLEEHPNIIIDLVTHPYPVSVRRREADIVLRVDRSDENLVGRKVGKLGVGFYASRGYAARHQLPKERADWKKHKVISFADRSSNVALSRWANHVVGDACVAMRCSSQTDMLAATLAGIGICAMSCIVGNAHPDLVRIAPDKLIGQSDLWLLAHPDLVEYPPVRAVLDFLAAQTKQDRDLLRGDIAT